MFDSIEDFVDESVVVIDSRHGAENTQKIKDICYQYTNKIFEYDWATDSFADARNEAIKHCSGDWIFTIDCDEVLEDYQEPNELHDFYCASVTNRIAGQDRTYPSVRLFKNHIGIWYSKARHETVEDTLDGKVQGGMNLKIRHTGYDGLDVKSKLLWLLEKHIEQLQTEPDNHSLKYHIAKCYWGLEDWSNTLDWAMLALTSPINREAKAQTMLMMYLCYKNLNKEAIGLMWLEYSINILPEQFSCNFLLYNFYLKAGDKNNMIKHLRNIKQTFNTGSRFPNDIVVEPSDIDKKLNELKEQ